MHKKTLILYCLTTILFFGCAEFSLANDVCQVNENQMPQYKVTFNLPLEDGNQTFGSRFLMLRFYHAYGDGDPFGWQTPVKAPRALLNDKPLLLYNYFSYDSLLYRYGSVGLGFDQYAQYFVAKVPLRRGNNQLILTGSFEQVAYVSATIYSSYQKDNREFWAVDFSEKNIQRGVLDWQMPVLDNACNPYIEGNPSVFSYPVPETSFHPQPLPAPEEFPKFNDNEVFCAVSYEDNGRVNLFRVNQEESMYVVADDIAEDGCSRAYLYGRINRYEHEMAILRIKVPTTFFNGDAPDKIFGEYDTRYLSVNSHRHTPITLNDRLLGFWGVHSGMLEEYQDEDGYAYVFFAPNEYVRELAAEQNTPATQPPVLTWGDYTGYVLGHPSYSIILRYRVPNPDWPGSPENAQCYTNCGTQRPVTSAELGEYLPEIYADTMDNFDRGRIGAVKSLEPWPED